MICEGERRFLLNEIDKEPDFVASKPKKLNYHKIHAMDSTHLHQVLYKQPKRELFFQLPCLQQCRVL